MVSAVHAETINSYIFAKKYTDAAQILLGLWAPLSKEPPRVIISMTKHGYQEGWLAHRFDLSNGHLTTHHCVHRESRVEPFDSRESAGDLATRADDRPLQLVARDPPRMARAQGPRPARLAPAKRQARVHGHAERQLAPRRACHSQPLKVSQLVCFVRS